MAAPQIQFRPFVEIAGTYNTGLAGVGVTDQGQLAASASPGMMLSWGISGAHSWSHTRVGLAYRGSISHYLRQTYYDSTTQSVMLSIEHRLSRRLTFNLNETAGWFSHNFVPLGLSQAVPFDPSLSYVPTTDFFDNRTIYNTSHADLVYQRSARLSFSFGGDGFVVRRRSAALSSVVGEVARGDVAYRVSRRSTIGAIYSFSHYNFTHYFGGTFVHGVAASYSLALSRWLELSAYVGAARVEMKTLQSVPIDPAIAALLGISTATQVFHTVSYVPSVGARLSRRFEDGVAYVTAGRGVMPGNGLFLTSYSTTILGGYSYTGVRRWSFDAGVAYSRNKAVGNVGGLYGGTSASVSAARQIVHSMHLTMSYSARHYDSPTYSNYNRLISEVRVGFGFAPGDIPLRIW